MDIQKLNQNLNKLNKFLFIILGIAVAIWIGVEVFIGSKVEYAKEQMKENLCEAPNVKEMLARLNSSLPSKLDEINTLEKIVCENRRFVYHYALGKGLEMDENALNDKDIAELKEEIVGIQEGIFNSKVINHDKWREFNEVKFRLVDPARDITYNTRENEIARVLKIAKVQTEEGDIDYVIKKNNNLRKV